MPKQTTENAQAEKSGLTNIERETNTIMELVCRCVYSIEYNGIVRSRLNRVFAIFVKYEVIALIREAKRILRFLHSEILDLRLDA